MKINDVYSVNKLNLLIQRDEQTFRVNIKQIIYVGKFCSF